MSLKNPQNKYRALPFWSWNGRLDQNELNRQVGILQEMGFGGAFMHSRCGLQTEYMSKEWLSLVDKTADLFDGKGMQGWLYDEDRWPSGSCGGLATEKTENRQKALSMYFNGDEAGYADKRILGIFAINLTGNADQGERHLGKRLLSYFPIGGGSEIPYGYERVVFVEELIEPSDFYNGSTYLDTLNKDAVKDFINLTHEKYKSALGDKLGREVKGIFLDEPHRGGVFNGFNITNKNARAMLPWSYSVFDLYAEKFGERVEERLPELFFIKDGEEFNRTAWRYLEVLQTQFLSAFAKPYYDWCKQNGLLVTGHVWDENTLLGQINWQGSVMRYYEYMDIPGIDNLRDDNYFFAAPLQAVSVAKQTGKTEVLSEMYACTGWKTTFDYYKRSGDWQAILGINVRCPHLSWYTMGGEAKRDCPASIFFQAGWYKEYKYIEDYFARLNMTFGKAEYTTDILLLSPIESAWGTVRAGAYFKDEGFRNLESGWREVIEEMLFKGLDFDLADEDILSRKAFVEVKNGQACVVVGQMKYKTLVMPPMLNVRKSTLGILKAFASHGGRIICVGNLPSHVDGVKRNTDLDVKAIPISDIASLIEKDYSIDFSGKMLSKMKVSGDKKLLYAIAFDCEDKSVAKISLNGEHSLTEINLRTGEKEGVLYQIKDGKTVAVKELFKGEELLLEIDGEKVDFKERKDRREIALSDELFDYELNEPNVLPLDYAELWIDGEYQGRDEFLKIDKKIRAKFGLKERSANNKQPWFEEKYNASEYNKKLCRARLRYKFKAEFIPSDCYLMIESLPNATWRFNGKELKKSGYKPFIEDICFDRLDLSGECFKVSENHIEVEFDFTPSCNLETVFLVGGFTVDNATRIIKPLPKKIAFGDICDYGFPFYTGAITYRIPVEKGIYDVEDLCFNAACVKVRNKISAFNPFTVAGVEVADGVLPLTAVLLRRNLFGPLHEIPKNHGNYWSGSFRTEGDKFTEDYQINGQGILKMPKIYVRSEANEKA